MERVCFLIRVKPECLEEYKQRHKEVWPEMLEALRETGWHNCSLFLRDDGLMVGYLETPTSQRPALEWLRARSTTCGRRRWLPTLRKSKARSVPTNRFSNSKKFFTWTEGD